jgi:O-Antigen ligase
LINAQDIAIQPHTAAIAAPHASAATFKERLLLLVLYVTVLASSVAFIEPSPHDGLMIVLALACVIAGVHFERRLALLFIFLLIFNIGGLLSTLNVAGQEKAVQYAATSVYLAIAALVFACLFSERTMSRLATMRAAYVLTAVIVASAGICGYFNVFPGAESHFAQYGRAQGFFKDPNVFGPFLIWPALIVAERMIVRRATLLDMATVFILLLALLLCFSRGAWFHFGVSAAVTIVLAFATSSDPRVRFRIVTLTAISIAALVAFVAIALSFDSVASMFKERFQLVQSYDVGQGGRFELQELALAALFKYPNGMGPFEFSRVHGLQQHNVYLQAFMVYGWLGGVTYIMLLAATVTVALRSVFIATPWQPYLITAFATFAGEVLEGFVIDTDHWRHFFLLLGMVWGLWAATVNYQRKHQTRTPGRWLANVNA